VLYRAAALRITKSSTAPMTLLREILFMKISFVFTQSLLHGTIIKMGENTASYISPVTGPSCFSPD
jgi:hypothetical protein